MALIKKLRYGCLFLLQCCGLYVAAQNNTLIKYYDSLWLPAPQEKAMYYSEIVKNGNAYTYTSYWKEPKKLNCIATYADTSFGKQIGLLRRYYQNGQLQDSTFTDDKNTLLTSDRFYENGRHHAHYVYNKNPDNVIEEGYDEKGKIIPKFIYMREAGFKDGAADWQEYLGEQLKADVPVKKGAPKGSYQVIIRFIVGLDGSLSGFEPETHLGYGMEEEVIRVLKKSPKWHPAVWLNKTVKAFRRQPLTFQVEEK